MNANVSAALPYGPLHMFEVYFEQDGPKFFALAGQRFPMYLLVLCVDEHETELEYLALALGQERFFEVRAGHIDLRTAFEAAAPGDLWRVFESFGAEGTARAYPVALESIDADELPLEGARLALPTPSAPALDAAELERLGNETMRSIIALELTPHGESRTEFPVRGLGEILTNTQASADALAQEEYGTVTTTGAVAGDVLDGVQLSVMALRAASFALVLGTDKQGAMLEKGPKLAHVSTEFAKLVAAGTEPGALVELLGNHSSRVRGRFSALLRALGRSQSGIGVEAVPFNGPKMSAHMNFSDVARAIREIDDAPKTLTRLEVKRGTLLGSNARLLTFELFDNATGVRYSGKVDLEAASDIDGMEVGHASFVSATLRQAVDFAADEQTPTGRHYTLLEIDRLGDADFKIAAPHTELRPES